ncbi:tRNA (adenine(58)-N(1))-methyltransferase non-catalytic subunit trm6 [Harmonia axyridis]|uniref:tRNA (adenine(58)-N(1))-methyltransferase non-catalytic subunit trm6 n=1 Tax=Harmonia axyridis TaxID=115357 RepID=UPI001E27892E|nr:tRNA (adenine(58)-N(1))-methyltransferase non-catalytic subunit trm6 [Harmonia axyridis]
MEETIKVGDYVIVQRQNYTKLHKLKAHGTMQLGSFIIEMDNIVGEKYFDTFQIKNVPNTKRNYTLEKIEDASLINSNLTVEQSGNDNRNIKADDNNQVMSSEEINKLKDEELSSNNIVEKLISNSKTFSVKTEFSQEKYIKKKAKKYFEYVEIRRPNIRLLAQMFYRQDPSKILGIRIDDLSQILTYSNIQSEGTHILYDSGTSGLMSAALMETIGANTSGKLIHMHPGNECQKVAFLAMEFPEEQSKRCINVNLYSVLRHCHQGKSESDKEDCDTEMNDIVENNEKMETEASVEPDPKRRKVYKPTWQVENEEACQLLKEGVHSIVITAKEHPVNIVDALEPFLLPSRNLVVFSTTREPLQELYFHLKSKNFLAVRLTTNFMRNYQVLPERTHPEVNMTYGGYLLTAVKVTH